MTEQSKNKKLRRLVWVTSILSLVAVIIAISASWLLYEHTVTLITQNLRERLLTISITAAANIDARDLDALRVESDWTKPEWARVVNKLNKAKYSNKDIVFMYIFRKIQDDPNMMEFVADADSIDPYANTSSDTSGYVDVNRDGIVEPDGPDKLQWPGQPYPEASEIPEAFAAYDGPLTSTDLYADDYGTVLTGYAPIVDENGNVAAILATDIKADDFFVVTRQTLYPFLVFIGFLIAIILALAMILIYIWRKQARTLSAANEQLEIANTGQENLIHLINHQIKGYLAKSRNIFAELLSGQDYGVMPDTAKPMLQGGFDSLTEGVDFVQQVLKSSNATTGTLKYDMKAVDLKIIVEEAFEKQKSRAEEKELSYRLDISNGNYETVGDPLELKEAIRNLIDNSIIYTASGNIDVKLRRTGNKIKVSVKDTGVGLTPGDKSRLFTKGGRGEDSLKINSSSTGYGLAFVKAVFEAHGGKVWAESAGKEKGSEFIAEIPVNARNREK
jgi:signal transduction histidine kinase